ncbi:uncharacterized protein LOC110675197 [Aedes aegypti]|uniref:Uncharacterized protein n=1 Tax=Aedes aegypti TaxID=7159 RepID=A0A6I8TR86_AEDAE|nr:uncharacterized protein LOC110675197 [Aedes aegypti]
MAKSKKKVVISAAVKQTASKKVHRSVRKEAKSKNLDFLLAPHQNKNVDTEIQEISPEKPSTSTAVPQRHRSGKRPVELSVRSHSSYLVRSKENTPCQQGDGVSVSPPSAKRCAIRVPVIYLEKQNLQRGNKRSTLLRGSLSDGENDEEHFESNADENYHKMPCVGRSKDPSGAVKKFSQELTSTNQVKSSQEEGREKRPAAISVTSSIDQTEDDFHQQQDVNKTPSFALPAKRLAFRAPLIDFPTDGNLQFLKDWLSEEEDESESCESETQNACETDDDLDDRPKNLSKTGAVKVKQQKSGQKQTSGKQVGVTAVPQQQFAAKQQAAKSIRHQSGSFVQIKEAMLRQQAPSTIRCAVREPLIDLPTIEKLPLNDVMHPPSPTAIGSFQPNPLVEADTDFRCVCGQQAKIDQLIHLNNALIAQNKKLKLANEKSSLRCLTLTDALNAKVLRKTHDEKFTELPGFPDKNKLKKFSETAGSRDYIFVKLLLMEIFTDGLKNMTLTGRVTNNPNGRKGGERIQNEMPEKVRLDPEKVKYIEERFVEHRVYQGETPAVAGVKVKQCRELIARVLIYYGKK